MARGRWQSGCLRLLPSTPPANQADRPVDRWPVSFARPFEFSSLQINLPPAIDQAILAYGGRIPDGDLAEDGRTEQPHITVKQRLLVHQPEEVIALLTGGHTFDVTLGLTHVFTTPQDEIVHVDVASDELHALRRSVSTLPHRDPHAYHPHVTIAFVKRGCGDRYAGDDLFEGVTIPVRVLTYSSADGLVIDIPLVWNDRD